MVVELSYGGFSEVPCLRVNRNPNSSGIFAPLFAETPHYAEPNHRRLQSPVLEKHVRGHIPKEKVRDGRHDVENQLLMRLEAIAG